MGIGGVVVSCAIYATSTYLASDDHSTEKLIEGVKKDVILQDSATIKREADSIKESIDKLDKRLDKVEKALKSNPPKRKVMTR